MFYPDEQERGDDGRKIRHEEEYDEDGNLIPREGGSMHAVRLLTWVNHPNPKSSLIRAPGSLPLLTLTVTIIFEHCYVAVIALSALA